MTTESQDLGITSQCLYSESDIYVLYS